MIWNGSKFTQRTIRDIHVVLENKLMLSRLDIFTIIYACHLLVPCFGAYAFVMLPWIRPCIVAGLFLVLIGQLWAKCCPIAKLEWALVPESRQITWKGIDCLRSYIPITNKIRSIFMVGATICGIIVLQSLIQCIFLSE